MTSYQITLHKMQTVLENEKAHYYMNLDNEAVLFCDFLTKTIRFDYLNEINCLHCHRKTSKSFSQGYCFPCFRSLAQCDMCLMKPELCHYHLGTCREPQWGLRHCFQDHIIYLANTGDVKVGITRITNTPHRWIDQGATEVLPIARVKSRLISGLVEVELKKHIADKTNWRKMLKGQIEHKPLDVIRESIFISAKNQLAKIKLDHGDDALELLNEKAFNIHYPVIEYPEKIKSFNLDKNQTFSGKLLGIKGQYLLLDTGVINIRKYSGYKVNLSIT
ncbi:DUF2797 domain-containing protein [Thiotrichales bacterium 19S3-7]|nr:DUF2797 domain-containing protein [Thiotrichales bacterium 19S3-7]MCF6801561.1 DUF2797 domain-containing protein [Thiotrichales bacterium 19S3-11]